jgi:hypothetical protein
MLRPSFTNSPDYIQSLDRGLQVLRAFNRERPRCTLSEIATQIGLSRAVARRGLLTLQHLGYVAAQGRQFFLTPRVLELGYSYLSSLDLADFAHEPMEKLSERVGESCSMAVLDGSEIVYVARVAGRQIGRRTQCLVERKYFSLDHRAHDLQTARVASGNSESAPPRLCVCFARAGVGTVFNRGADSFRKRSGRVRA